jgi:hypothetical protein
MCPGNFVKAMAEVTDMPVGYDGGICCFGFSAECIACAACGVRQLSRTDNRVDLLSTDTFLASLGHMPTLLKSAPDNLTCLCDSSTFTSHLCLSVHGNASVCFHFNAPKHLTAVAHATAHTKALFIPPAFTLPQAGSTPFSHPPSTQKHN